MFIADELIVFRRLTREDMTSILQINLKEVCIYGLKWTLWLLAIFVSLIYPSPQHPCNLSLFQVDRRLDARKIRLNVPDTVSTWLCDHGFDPVFGARPLQRLVQRYIMNPLAKSLLDGSIRDGELVRVVRQNDEISIVPNHKAAV